MSDTIQISPELRAAIDNYFEVKRRGNGLFKDRGEQNAACDPILEIGKRDGLAVVIVPGQVYLAGDDTVYSFTVSHPEGFLDIEMTKHLRGIS